MRSTLIHLKSRKQQKEKMKWNGQVDPGVILLSFECSVILVVQYGAWPGGLYFIRWAGEEALVSWKSKGDLMLLVLSFKI